MKNVRFLIIVHFIFLMISYPVGVSAANKTKVSSVKALRSTLSKAKPGDVIVLANGIYTNAHVVFSRKGTKDKPITLKAQTPGKVVFNGSSALSIGGEYLVVDGLFFNRGAINRGAVIQFSWGKSHARNCVLKNTAIVNYNAKKRETRYNWVQLLGSDNIVENCWFSGQTHSGITVGVRLQKGKPARHIIRKNYFGPRPLGNANGFETIKIGTHTRSMTNARCQVSDNLFERCNGEIEIISNKSCENVYRGNTFLNCSGALTLRHGNRCTVENNVFYGKDGTSQRGLRVIGEEHRVVKNHFSDGNSLFIYAGIPNTPLYGYAAAHKTLVEDNVIIGGLALTCCYGSKGRTVVPKGLRISNNLIIGKKPGSKVKVPDVKYSGNVLVGEPQKDVPKGIMLVRKVPQEWKSRIVPKPLKKRDVGPNWKVPIKE